MFAGYRCYHQSNAHIYSSNNSVNLNQVEIGWTF
ncbi:acyloxyacyl hydrolase [Desulfopila aestuarii]